jgi:gluconate 2-dehydrogenase gamma chain
LDVEAIADRIIPPDSDTPGGKGAGCAVYVDRQLAGPYGRSEGLYLRPPFITGEKSQGVQSPLTPTQVYRTGLGALERHCRSAEGGRSFHELPADRQDEILHGLDEGHLKLEGADGKMFFEAVLQDVQTGFFADPVYGGNRDMCAWKMIGFPGAHYDYREWVLRHNEPFPTPPVAITGRRAWTPR